MCGHGTAFSLRKRLTGSSLMNLFLPSFFVIIPLFFATAAPVWAYQLLPPTNVVISCSGEITWTAANNSDHQVSLWSSDWDSNDWTTLGSRTVNAGTNLYQIPNFDTGKDWWADVRAQQGQNIVTDEVVATLDGIGRME